MRTKPSVPRVGVRPRPPTDADASLPVKIARTDLRVLIRYYQFKGSCEFSTDPTLTVKQLVDLIQEKVKPTKARAQDHPFLIKDGAVFLYKGQDLCRKDPMITLAQLGMVKFITILILYPGPFNEVVHLPRCSKSLELKALAESASRSAQAGIPMIEFLKKTGSADMKRMKIEIPVSDDTVLIISGKINLTHQIRDVKLQIKIMIRSCAGIDDFSRAYSLYGRFDIYLGDRKLDPDRVVRDYPVCEFCHMKVSSSVSLAKVRKNGLKVITEPMDSSETWILNKET